MATITKISPQKNKKRVNIYLDNKFGFGLDLENFMKLGLIVDQELSKKEIREIKLNADKAKVVGKLLNFATLRPRSEKEVVTWFKKKKVDEKDWNGYFNRLNRLDLIDDKKFAEWWIQQRLTFKKKSKKELQYELRLKGIERNIIADVLADAEIDEEKTAKELIEKKKYKWERYEKEVALQKQKEFLLRRGFSWSIVSKVVQ